MIKVTVPAMPTRNQKGIGKASGKPYDMEFQTVYFHTMMKDGTALPFPEKCEIILDRDGQGFPIVNAPGEYQLHPNSLYVDRNGSLAVAPRLVAVERG